ncbi:MAG TPA: Uma2 family endonuclease [Acetobacteraceae bacterium]|jgi:Uma2 family endonuclease|nr:Uma2 family endonuclease [Acetobacteraceae bacterium]
MSEARHRETWSWDAYLEWEAREPVRYELVDGQVYAMGGGTARHDMIGNNLRGELRAQMRGKLCRVHGPDLKVKAGQDGRYPDALIDCGPSVLDALFAQEPVAVFEVLFKSTGWIDQTLKLRDYDATPSIRTYALISQDEQRALVYTRDPSGRLGIQNTALLEGAEASIEIPELGVVLPFTALYEGVTFGPDQTPGVGIPIPRTG